MDDEEKGSEHSSEPSPDMTRDQREMDVNRIQPRSQPKRASE